MLLYVYIVCLHLYELARGKYIVMESRLVGGWGEVGMGVEQLLNGKGDKIVLELDSDDNYIMYQV